MLNNMIFSLNSTMPLFLIMVLGYVMYHRGMLTEKFAADANKLVFYIALPFMLFLDMAQTDLDSNFDWSFVGFCFIATIVSISLMWILAHALLPDKTQVGEFVQASYRSSAAILGAALTQMIYGTSGASSMMILGSVPLYNIFAVLILVLEGPGRDSGKPLGPQLKASLKKIVTNPIILGVVLGFVWAFFKLPLPSLPKNAMSSLSKMTSPLALLAIGAEFKGKNALGKLKLTGCASVIKLLILPAIYLPLAALLGFTGEKMVAVMIMGGSITTPSSYVMARQMGHEGTLTASVCAVTTVASCLTLTWWLFFMSQMGWL